MKGDKCFYIERVNEHMKELGLKPYSSAYLCQEDSCGGCHIYEIAVGKIPDYLLK